MVDSFLMVECDQELNQFPMVVYLIVVDPQPSASELALGGRSTSLVRRVPGEEKARELTFQLAAIERKQKEGTVGLRAASASWKGSEEERPLLSYNY